MRAGQVTIKVAHYQAEPLVICANCGNSKEPTTASRACWLVGPFFANGSGLVGRSQERSSSAMCDYSLHNVKSRPAKVGDKLTTHHFNTGTRGLAAPEDANTAVCVLPGTELAFAREVGCRPRSLLGWKARTVNHTTAIFRQINKD